MDDVSLPLLWLAGPTGVGKSSAGWEVFAQVSRGGVRAAFVDADQVNLCYPAPEEDTHRLRARNLAAMVPNFVREGARCLVLAGFVDTPREVAEYTRLLPGAELTVCRLRVDEAELERRFLARGWRPDLVGDAAAEARAQDRTSYAGLCLDTTGMTVSETARLVRERAGGWPRVHPHEIDPPLEPGRPAPGGERVPVVWFTGATAVGKSTVGYEVFGSIARSGVRAAYIDVKQIGALRPVPDGDPALHRLKARNLAAVWAGHRAVGARCLVVSGDADADDTVRAYAGLLPGTDMTVCRLHATPETLAERVARRAQGEGPALPGNELRGLAPDAVRRVSERAAREAEALERDGAGDLRIETDGRTVQEIVAEVRDRAMSGFPGVSGHGVTRPSSSA